MVHMVQEVKQSVVVVSRQMPWDGLCWGRWTPEDPGRDDVLKSTHGRTRARTQVRGSPIEIKPLLLHLECISVWSQELQRLLELYEAGGEMSLQWGVLVVRPLSG